MTHTRQNTNSTEKNWHIGLKLETTSLRAWQWQYFGRNIFFKTYSEQIITNIRLIRLISITILPSSPRLRELPLMLLSTSSWPRFLNSSLCRSSVIILSGLYPSLIKGGRTWRYDIAKIFSQISIFNVPTWSLEDLILQTPNHLKLKMKVEWMHNFYNIPVLSGSEYYVDHTDCR